MNTIDTMLASFSYLSVHYKGEQLNAAIFNPSVTAITNNLSKWRRKNNKSHITRLRKTLHVPLYLFHLLGQTSNLQAYDSAEEN